MKMNVELKLEINSIKKTIYFIIRNGKCLLANQAIYSGRVE